jgi:hypothetical protein
MCHLATLLQVREKERRRRFQNGLFYSSQATSSHFAVPPFSENDSWTVIVITDAYSTFVNKNKTFQKLKKDYPKNT